MSCEFEKKSLAVAGVVGILTIDVLEGCGAPRSPFPPPTQAGETKRTNPAGGLGRAAGAFWGMVVPRTDSSVVERGPEKAGVGGSIPSLATTL